ncbi:MAG TPA: hypothetical protein DEP84_28385 [Chloroflexi bacterium]|nr:hypothetical protein [Chloroflexota bacterium]
MPTTVEPIRDTFWNVPHWAEIALYTTMAVATLAMLYGLYRRLSLYRQGQPEWRFDHLPERVGRVLVYALGQLRLARQSYPGFMHLFMFWSFLVLLLGTTLATVDNDITLPFLHFKLLKGTFYLTYETVLDIFGLLFLVGLGMGWYRRYVKGSVRLGYDWGWAFTLGSLFLINLTGFVVEAFRIAVVRPWWQLYSPVGYVFSLLFTGAGMSEAAMRATHLFFWLAHFALVGLFLAAIPYTPLMHILTSPLNIFFSRLGGHPQALRPIPDLEQRESWGVGRLSDFSWKQLLDFDACTECGRCQIACPAWNAGTPLNPKRVVLDLRNHMLATGGLPSSQIGGFSDGDFNEQARLGQELVGCVIKDETLWACTTCRACVYECPVFIEHVDSIVDMRRHLVMTEGRMPDTVSQGLRNLERAGNPWGYAPEDRARWADGLNVPVLEDQEVEYLYWVGCAASYDQRNQRIARAFVRLMEAAGVDYAVLGSEESCNGDPARRLGNEYLFKVIAENNIEILNSKKFKKIVTACPHCFNILGNEYEPFGGRYEVIHHSQLLAELVASGRITASRHVDEIITFHDSCYLGRYNGVFDAPREILASVPGVELREMPRSRERGLCCGGGGGGMWVEIHGERRINEIRLREAQSVNPNTVASACPFCMFMFDLGVKVIGIDEDVELKDVAEVLAESALGPDGAGR